LKNIAHDFNHGVKRRYKNSYTVSTVLNAENGCNYFNFALYILSNGFNRLNAE